MRAPKNPYAAAHNQGSSILIDPPRRKKPVVVEDIKRDSLGRSLENKRGRKDGTGRPRGTPRGPQYAAERPATTRQKLVLRVIHELTTSERGPTYRAVQERMGWKSPRAVQKHVIWMKLKGLIAEDTSKETGNGIQITERGMIVLRIFLRTAEAFATINEDDDTDDEL